MMARFLQSCCEPSVPMLGQGHDGRGGGAICGHGVCDPAVSDPGLELSDGGGEVVISDDLLTHFARPG